MIQIEQVVRRYQRGGETLTVLDGLDLEIEEGGFYSLMGPSGSGKTTLLNLVGGLDRPDGGRLLVDGQDITGLTGSALSSWRSRTIGFVFQGFNLIPVLTARENVALPLLLTPLSRKKRREHTQLALELVGLADRSEHRPDQLSGGQEQRVAIARAVVTDPKIILADEPTGDLDRASADGVLDLLVRLHQELGKTILVVTHDPLAAARATKIIHLDKGRLGRIEETDPAAN